MNPPHEPLPQCTTLCEVKTTKNGLKTGLVVAIGWSHHLHFRTVGVTTLCPRVTSTLNVKGLMDTHTRREWTNIGQGK